MSGLALIVAGVWVAAQVTVGNALGRLGVIDDSAPPAAGDAPVDVPSLGGSIPTGTPRPPASQPRGFDPRLSER